MLQSARRQSSRRRGLWAWAPAAAALGAAVLCHPVHAQTGPTLLLKPFPKEQAIEGRADALFIEPGHTKKGDDAFRLSAYESQGRWRVQPGNLISPRVGWDFTFLDLHTRSPGLPDQLADQSVAVAMPVAKFGEWIVGASAGLGYAGDRPFADGDAWYGKGTLSVFRLFNDTDALVFALDYDGNRTILPDVPLPGIAYTKRVARDLFFVVGVPVTSVEWRPDDRLRVEVVYTLPDTLDASVGYRVARGVTVFGNFENRREAFHLDGLRANYDRLLFEQRRAEIGLRWEPKKDVMFNLAGGYAFGQEFSTGFDSRETDLVADLSDEPYVRVGVDIRF
jgi:hypothetical protein